MATIKTQQEIYAEVISERRDQAKAKFGGAIRPIYGSTETGQPDHIGSCTLLKVGGGSQLLTAAHVIDMNEQSTLYIAGETKLVALEADFFATNKPEGNRDNDKYDFALGAISLDLEAKLGNVQYLTPADIITTIIPTKAYPVASG